MTPLQQATMLHRPGSWLGFRAAVPHTWSPRLLLSRPRRPFCAARRHGLAAAAASETEAAPVAAAGASAVQQLVASGRVNKTALGKLAVADLRQECALAGLPADGTKPVLVERLLAWATAQQEGGSGGSSTQAAAAPASGPSLQQQQPSVLRQAVAAVTAAALPATAPAPAPERQQLAAPAPPAATATAAAPAVSPAQEVASLTFLGTSSGNPTSRRNVSCVAVQLGGGQLVLVDAGEGSRNQLRRAGLDAARVRHLFVTHMHGDHCFGVCGVLMEICQARLGTPQQQEPIHVYGPPELQSLVVGTFRLASMQLTTPVVMVGWVLDAKRAHGPRPVDATGMLQLALVAPDQAAALTPETAERWQAEYDSGSDQVVHAGLTWTSQLPGGVRVTAAQLQHRVPCWGYVFQEPHALVPPPAAVPGDAASSGAPQQQQQEEVEQQQQQQQWARRGRKLVVLGDTCDSHAIAAAARNCDVISHEATFMRGMEQKAEIATHSTSDQAGAFAAEVKAQALVLTHFSARYATARDGGGGGGGRGGRGGRGGGGGQRGGRGEEAEQDLDEGELQAIVRQAQSTFRSDRVYLASDYYTFKVYPHDPVPLPPGATLAYLDTAAGQGTGYASSSGDGNRARQWAPPPQYGDTRAPAQGYSNRGGYQQQQQRPGGQRWQDGPPRRSPGYPPQQQQRYGGQQRQWSEAPGGSGGGSRAPHQQQQRRQSGDYNRAPYQEQQQARWGKQ